MLRTVVESPSKRFRWLDLVEPTSADLEELAARFGLTAMAVQDCLDPEHLPKFEQFDGTRFVILRACDEAAERRADTVQSLTRKVAIFWGDDFLITIHRKDQPYLTAVMADWGRREGDPALSCAVLLVDLALAVIASYEPMLTEAESRIDGFEATLLRDHDVARLLQEMYQVKRRINLAKRLLWRTTGVVVRLSHGVDLPASAWQNLREGAESMHFYADELIEDVNNLLQMQLALAAHRTNGVIQVLTVFSAFFLPLTFIVGVYGMNFAHMPELASPWGYPAILLVMTAVSLVIWTWFRRRGWL